MENIFRVLAIYGSVVYIETNELSENLFFFLVQDIGAGRGKHYAVNFPLRDGIDDDAYETIFKPVMTKVMESYQPNAIVLQCGADSLTGDRLGCFNLTLKGPSFQLEFISIMFSFFFQDMENVSNL